MSTALSPLLAPLLSSVAMRAICDDAVTLQHMLDFEAALAAKVAAVDANAARYVHWGATSQDVIDTATMLGLRAAIDALLADCDRAIAGFAALAIKHRNTAVVARTWLQHALPMPFGLKLAEY